MSAIASSVGQGANLSKAQQASIGICSYVVLSGMMLGLAALSGHLVPEIGTVSAVALVGLNIIISQVATWILIKIAKKICEKNKINVESKKAYLPFALLLIGCTFAYIAASWALCNCIGGLSSYSYVDALKMYGVFAGIVSGIVVGMGCLCLPSISLRNQNQGNG